MRSVRSTPRCPSASSPVQPGAERATTKVSCTCVGHVSTCPPPPCLRRAGRHVRALQQRARVLQAVPSQVRAELPRPGHHRQLVECTCPHATLSQVENPQCERFASSPAVPNCYYTPCSQECMDQAKDNKCPRQVAWSHPNTGHHNLMTLVFSVSEVQG